MTTAEKSDEQRHMTTTADASRSTDALKLGGTMRTFRAAFDAASSDDQVVVAKQARADIIEILDACTCLLPFQVHGIVHNGHRADCAAVPVVERIRARGGFA